MEMLWPRVWNEPALPHDEAKDVVFAGVRDQSLPTMSIPLEIQGITPLPHALLASELWAHAGPPSEYFLPHPPVNSQSLVNAHLKGQGLCNSPDLLPHPHPIPNNHGFNNPSLLGAP